jgi:hypothetical protein
MTPKLHFPCTGLACHLLHIDSAQKRTHTSRGPMFESWAVREAVKHRWNEGLDSGLHFWGDNHVTEVDLMRRRSPPSAWAQSAKPLPVTGKPAGTPMR